MKAIKMFILALIVMSCAEDQPLSDSTVSLIQNGDTFDNLANGETAGDPFSIYSVKRNDQSLEVVVQYSGGCEQHDFEVVAKVGDDYFPGVSLALVHLANGDMCEAYLTDTLTIDFSGLLASSIIISEADVSLIHGYNKDEYFLAHETMNIRQGMGCNLSASFEEVVCGAGFFDNRWFRSTDAGLLEEHDFFYFQPIEYDLDDVPALGEYQLSVRILRDYEPDGNTAICRAYPGYSIPVKITCIAPKE